MKQEHTKRFELILDECLDRIASGESIADVLASYPEQSSSLEPLLRAARVTLDAGRFEPSEAGITLAREKFARARIARAAHSQSTREPSIMDRLRRFRLPATTIATIAVLALTAVLLVRPTLETGEIPLQPPQDVPPVSDDTPQVDTTGEPAETDVPDATGETPDNPTEDVPEAAPVIASPDSSGSFVFYLSDQPNDIGDFAELLVTVSRIQLKPHGDGPWVEIVPEPVSVDLSQLQGARAMELWRGDVPEGEYDTVYLTIGAVQGTLVSTGQAADVMLPSDRLHIQSSFTANNEEDTRYVFDITVHRTGNDPSAPRYVVSPQASESGVDREVEPVEASEIAHGQAASPPGKANSDSNPGQADPPVADKPGPGPGRPAKTRTVKNT